MFPLTYLKVINLCNFITSLVILNKDGKSVHGLELHVLQLD